MEHREIPGPRVRRVPKAVLESRDCQDHRETPVPLDSQGRSGRLEMEAMPDLLVSLDSLGSLDQLAQLDNQGSRDRREIPVFPDLMEQLERQEERARLEIREPKDLRDLSVLQELPVSRELRDQLASLVNLDSRVRRVLPEAPDQRVTKGLLETLEAKDKLEQRVLQVCRVARDSLEQQVIQVNKVRLEQLVKSVYRELLVPLGLEATMAQSVRQDLMVSQELLAVVVSLVKLGRSVQADSLVSRVIQDSLAPQALSVARVSLAQLAALVARDNREQLVRLVIPEPADQRVRLDRRDRWGNPDHKEWLASLDRPVVRVAQDLRVNLDPKERSDRKGRLDLRDHLDLVEQRDSLEHLVTQAILERLEPSVLLDSLDRLETLEFQDLGV